MGRVLAHGTGPGHDLPIPLFYAVAGGALAVFVSFLAVGLLWSDSRLRGATAGRPAHDRAVRLFEPRTAISGQIPLMVLMVIVTISGLTLLAIG